MYMLGIYENNSHWLEHAVGAKVQQSPRYSWRSVCGCSLGICALFEKSPGLMWNPCLFGRGTRHQTVVASAISSADPGKYQTFDIGVHTNAIRVTPKFQRYNQWVGFIEVRAVG